jgi:hypothetical protein
LKFAKTINLEAEIALFDKREIHISDRLGSGGFAYVYAVSDIILMEKAPRS